MKKTIFILLITLYLSLLNVTAFGQQGFSYTENTKINDKVDSLLNLYSLYAGFTETGSFIYLPYIDYFKNLFSSDAYVYNDIEPNKKKRITDSLITINEYVGNVQRYYNKGLIVELADIMKGEIVKISDNKYIKIVTLNKKISGYHEKKGDYKNDFNLIFKIGFIKQKNSLKDFKIEKIIRNKPVAAFTQDIYTIKPKLFIELYYIPVINCKPDFFPDNWTVNNSEMGYNIGTQINYFINDNLIIGSGLEISKYKKNFKLDNYENTLDTIDRDKDNYIMMISGSTNEDLELFYLDVPIFLKYQSKMHNKIGYNFCLGTKVSYLLSGKYNANGIFTYKGLYEKYNNIIISDIPEYGFYSDKEVKESNENDPLQIKSLNISAFVSFNICIQLNDYVNLNLGPCFIIGLTDISNYNYSKEYHISKNADDYHSLLGLNKNIKTQAFGFKFGISFLLK